MAPSRPSRRSHLWCVLPSDPLVALSFPITHIFHATALRPSLVYASAYSSGSTSSDVLPPTASTSMLVALTATARQSSVAKPRMRKRLRFITWAGRAKARSRAGNASRGDKGGWALIAAHSRRFSVIAKSLSNTRALRFFAELGEATIAASAFEKQLRSNSDELGSVSLPVARPWGCGGWGQNRRRACFVTRVSARAPNCTFISIAPGSRPPGPVGMVSLSNTVIPGFPECGIPGFYENREFPGFFTKEIGRFRQKIKKDLTN